MPAAAAELQRAIFAKLRGDAALTALLGSNKKIIDHAPADVPFPYLSFGRTSGYDWSTGTELGSEHIISLHAWSKGKGKKEALDIIERAEALLHDQALTLNGFNLVNLRAEFSEVRYDEDQMVYHGLVRFRAVVEIS